MSGRVIASGLTQDRTFAFPDANGTIVVTGSSPSFTIVSVGDGTVGAPAVTFASQTNKGLYSIGSDQIGIATGGAARFSFGLGNFSLNSGGTIEWASGTVGVTATDLILARDAADTLAQRRGTNPQAFNVYNTYTNASNYERATFLWSGNTFFLATQALGTGVARSFIIDGAGVLFRDNGVSRWLIDHTTGGFLGYSATGGLGYTTGAGGAVTQATSRTTGVTLNTVTGDVTLFSAAGSATAASFTVTNSAVVATDNIVINQKSGTNLYNTIVTTVGAGSFVVTFYTTGGTAVDAPVFHFSVIKGVSS